MKQTMRYLLFFTLSLLISNSFADSFKLNNGDFAPDYLGKDSKGEKVFVSENKGKVIIVSFWASWCPPCRKEIPILDKLQTYLGTERIQVVAVNYKENRRQYRKLTKKFTGSNIALTHDANGHIGERYGVGAIPHLIIIDKNGKVAHQSRGYGTKTFNALTQHIKKLL